MLSRFSVKRPYTILVAVILVVVLGVVSITSMTTDLFPNMDFPYAIVMTTYGGANPETVESVVTSPVESSMATVSNIDNVSSVSSENYSMVILEFNESADMDSVLIEMRENLDQVSVYWPDGVGSPIIMKLNPDMMPVMVAAVGAEGLSGTEVSEFVSDQIVPELESIEGVASVSTTGDIEESIQVLIQQDYIDKINKKIVNALDQKFAGLEKTLTDGKEELESGKAELKSGQAKLDEKKGEAASQFAGADQELANNQSDLVLAEIELNNQINALNSTKTQLETAKKQMEQIQTSVTTLENNRATLQTKLEEAQTALEKIEANMEGISKAIENAKQIPGSEDLIAEFEAKYAVLEASKTELVNTIGMLTSNIVSIDKALGEIDSQLAEKGYSRAQVPVILSGFKSQITEVKKGLAALEQAKTKLNKGKITLNEAMQELNKTKTLTIIEIATAESSLNSGEKELQAAESELKEGEEALKSEKENAYNSADAHEIITTELVETILGAQNFSMPAGYITEDGVSYLVRVGTTVEDEQELGELVMLDLGMEGLDPIKLSDVADIAVVDNSSEVYTKLNGNNGVMLMMQKQTDYSTGDVSDRIGDKFKKLAEEYENVRIVPLMDQGVYIDLVIGSVIDNMLYGGLFAILVLLLFLKDWKPTLAIALSIPISILGAIALMYFSGITLNVISLSGLALGVGMLVDNSIVVIENIYRMRNLGVPIKKAAVEGAKEVAGAITSSTLTTVSVFIPIVFTAGITRQLFVDMGLTIAYSLLASLAVALTLIPAISSGLLKRTSIKQHRFLGMVERFYGKSLKYILKYKIAVLIVTVLFLGLSLVGIFLKGTALFPEMESTQVSVTLSLPEDTIMEDASRTTDQVVEKLLEIEDVEDVGAMTGGTNTLMLVGGSADFSGSSTNDVSEVSIYVSLREDKKLTNQELTSLILEKTEDIDCEVIVDTSAVDMSALSGSGISVRIKGRELDTLRELGDRVAQLVENVDGTTEVDNGIGETTPEIRVIVDKNKAVEYGLTVAQIYSELAKKLGEAGSATTVTTDAKDLDVLVLDSAEEQQIRSDIENITFAYTDDENKEAKVKLKDLADFEEAEGMASISRDGQSRYIDVTATIDSGYNIGLVGTNVQSALNKLAIPEGYTVEMVGEDQSINDTLGELAKMLVLGVVFIYLIMVAQFQSLLSPFIIMFTIPLAFTGGFLGLILTNNELSVVAVVGLIMLTGIIVNNGIVLVDYINQLRKDGMEKKEAIMEAGRTRLRPVMMTALTTILGLTTMAVGIGVGSDMMQPMAIVTISGLIYGTLLTLLVIPCMYDLFYRKKEMKEIDLETE